MALTKVIGAGLGATQEGAITFNEGSADADFRVESNGQTHMLFVDGGNNSVGLGSSTPDSGRKLHIEGNDTTVGITLKDTAGGQFGINSDGGSLTIKSDSTATVYMIMDSTGAVTLPKQPAFMAYASSQDNIAVASDVTVTFANERFDNNADFSSPNFTAPVTGRYQLNASIYLAQLDSASGYYFLQLTTSNEHYYNIIATGNFDGDPSYWTLTLSHIVDMDANDTAKCIVVQSHGTAQTDINANSFFSGYLVC